MLVLFLDQNAEEETEGGSERLDNTSTMGEDEIYGEEVFNQSDNTFEEIEEDIVEVAESAEATRERLAEARLAQDRIAREREKQRRARAARRSVGFVDENESEHDMTFNHGGDDDYTGYGSGDNVIYNAGDEVVPSFTSRTLGPVLRSVLSTNSSGGAGPSGSSASGATGSSGSLKRKAGGSTSSSNCQDDMRRRRPRPPGPVREAEDGMGLSEGAQ